MDQAWRANLSNAENAAALRAADGLTNREIAADARRVPRSRDGQASPS
jgi:hypothetical protein